MFTTILWASDGSEHAERALRFAVELAEHEHAELHAVHVVEKLVTPRASGLDVFLDEDETRQKLTDQIRAATADHPIMVSTHLVPGAAGKVAVTIAELASELGADVIVVGTRGHSAVGSLVLGGVTQRLLHVSPAAVLAVPPTVKEPRRLTVTDPRTGTASLPTSE